MCWRHLVDGERTLWQQLVVEEGFRDDDSVGTDSLFLHILQCICLLLKIIAIRQNVVIVLPAATPKNKF